MHGDMRAVLNQVYSLNMVASVRYENPDKTAQTKKLNLSTFTFMPPRRTITGDI